MVNRTCPCGNVFTTTQRRLDEGRGRYCSRACKYRYQVRPSGLKYNVKVTNRAWIKPGQQLSPGTQFKPGERTNPETEFKPGQIPANFKGDAVGYGALHTWVRRHRGAPTRCEHCGASGRIEWANKSHEYRRDLGDWLALCPPCHAAYDAPHAGAKRDRFPDEAEYARLQARKRRAVR